MSFPKNEPLVRRLWEQLSAGAKPVNPRFHDEFIALCALFFSGELSDEEWALLQVHLAYCDPCRRSFEEFQKLHGDVIPALAAAAAGEAGNGAASPAFDLDKAEQRLLRELGRLPVPARKPRSVKIGWGVAAMLAGAVALGVGWLSYLHFMRSTPGPGLQAAASRAPESHLPQVTPARKASVPKISHGDMRASIDHLEQELNEANGRYKQLHLTANDMRQQLSATQLQMQRTSTERDALSQQLAQTQTELESLRARMASDSSAAQDQSARLANMQATITVLTASLDEKNRMLALDEQFLNRDRQIRNLIAARHLYIADIYDVKDDGETAKPFGRLFYTKDTSLVFYGYDLEKQTRRNRLVSFQVWGSGDDQPDVSLGLFSRDGSQKCWILHFDDARTLARLNKVFVTVEPPGGSEKPTGKQILMAYLRIQPNHP